MICKNLLISFTFSLVVTCRNIDEHLSLNRIMIRTTNNVKWTGLTVSEEYKDRLAQGITHCYQNAWNDSQFVVNWIRPKHKLVHGARLLEQTEMEQNVRRWKFYTMSSNSKAVTASVSSPQLSWMPSGELRNQDNKGSSRVRMGGGQGKGAQD